jgi:hypothetical protein
MGRLLHCYRILNILSIDIVIGAVISSLFFAKLLTVTIRPYGLSALALTVWIVYTADHLKDAWSIKKEASSPRHLFHQRHFKVLFALMVFFLLVDCVLIGFIRIQVFTGGCVLAVLVMVYLLIQRRLFFLKELFVAVLYTSGILLPSVAVVEVDISISHGLLMIQFFVLALLNLLIFSWFDSEFDQHDNQRSFVTWTGRIIAWKLIWILGGLLIVFSMLQVILSNFSFASVIVLVMSVVLMIIFGYWRFFSRKGNYRLFGDAIFFIPIMIWL